MNKSSQNCLLVGQIIRCENVSDKMLDKQVVWICLTTCLSVKTIFERRFVDQDDLSVSNMNRAIDVIWGGGGGGGGGWSSNVDSMLFLATWNMDVALYLTACCSWEASKFLLGNKYEWHKWFIIFTTFTVQNEYVMLIFASFNLFPSQTELKVINGTSSHICPTQIQSNRTFCETAL